MRIDVAVLVENTRRIFSRAREGNLGSRRIFLTVLADLKKLLAGRYFSTPGLNEYLKATLSDRMQNLYQEWYVLEDEQKAHVKSYTISKMETDLRPVYNSIIEIFILWDDTQKNGAAPGYDYNDDILSPYYSDIRGKIRRVLEYLESSVK